MFFSLLPVKKAIVGHLFQLSANSGNKSIVLAWMWVMWKHLIHGSWRLAILGHRLALSWSNPSPRWLCMSLLNHYPSAVQGKWGLARYMLQVNPLQAIRSLPILCFPCLWFTSVLWQLHSLLHKWQHMIYSAGQQPIVARFVNVSATAEQYR